MKKKYLIIIVILLLITGCKYQKYQVTFIDDNKELSSITVFYGDNIENIAKPEKEGYIFHTWLKDNLEYDPSTPIKEDITLIASWVEEPIPPNMHKVIFNFGEYKKSQTVEDGEYLSIPNETPKKDKYKFLGWYLNDELYDFNTPVTSNIEIIAKFEKARILINYDLSGASGIVQVEIDKGSIPSKPKTPLKFGYTFTNWTISDKIYNFDSPLYDDTIIKANYIANVYVKITFDTDGGSVIPSQMILSGSSLPNIPTPTKEGYTFLYWSYDDNKLDINTKFDKDTLLKAIYEENSKIENEQNEEELIYN